MLSILAWLVKIFNLLTQIHQQNVQILTGQKQIQADTAATLEQVTMLTKQLDEVQEDIEIIEKVLGVGVPIQETIIFGTPKP